MMHGTWQKVNNLVVLIIAISIKTRIHNYMLCMCCCVYHIVLMLLHTLGVGKKIDELAKQRSCKEVGPWKKSIVNHLYWCGASSSSGKEIVAKWRSVVNHVQDIHEHEGEFQRCQHPPLVGDQARQWLKPSK